MICLANAMVWLRNLILATTLVAAMPLAAARAADTPPPMISVTGEATVSASPDLAEVDGGVTTQAKTAREASDANNKAMGAVLAALKGAGVAEADIRTSRLSLQPQMAPTRASPDAPPAIVGYRASNRVTIRAHDMTKVANTIDTLLAAGANDIGGVDFMVSNASKWLDEARPKAIADARRKAEIYAKAAGVAIGAPLSISEGSSSGPIAPKMFRAGMAAAAPTPIAAGDETLTITVSVSYEIKPATP
jgi:uncharacterized protein YggE